LQEIGGIWSNYVIVLINNATETKLNADREIPHVVIRAGGISMGDMLREVIERRDLILILAWRDISIRYKQSFLGTAWVILQPLLLMLVFTTFMGRVVRVPSDGLPYPIFVFAGLMLWQFFAAILTRVTNSVINTGEMIRKVYFPRLSVPIAAALPAAYDLLFVAITFICLLSFYVIFKGLVIVITWKLLLIPFFILLAAITALGFGIWFSCWGVRYRDINHLLPVIVQIWFFASPVTYPTSLVHGKTRLLYGLNPMMASIDGVKWCIFGDIYTPGIEIIWPILISIFILITGIFFFHHAQRKFADDL
jgi:lipopolysaccharide transport system permease protein